MTQDIRLYPRPLTREDALDLGPRVRQADRDDLLIYGADPSKALLLALEVPGDAWAVMYGEELIGAGGWTADGAIWSLWQDLTRGQSRAILRVMVPWCRIISIRAKGQVLSNVFQEGNGCTERFLRASSCFVIDPETVWWSGRQFVPFHLKPLEELL